MHDSTKRALSLTTSGALLGVALGAFAQRQWDLPFPPREYVAVAGEPTGTAQQFFGPPLRQPELFVADAMAGHLRRGNISRTLPWPEHPDGEIVLRTNNLGFREDQDTKPNAENGARRVLVLGDSHTDGLVNNHESFANRIEDALRTRTNTDWEVINGGVGLHGPHNYVGALERHLPLAPDAVIVTVYTGNDFLDSARTAHLRKAIYVPPRSTEYEDRLRAARRISNAAVSQALNQAFFLAQFDTLIEVVERVARRQLSKLLDRCRDAGATPFVLLLPTKLDVDWPRSGRPSEWPELQRTLLLAEPALTLHRDLAARLMLHLRRRGSHSLDLLPALQRQRTPMFWEADYHLNVDGHSVVAEAFVQRFGDTMAEL